MKRILLGISLAAVLAFFGAGVGAAKIAEAAKDTNNYTITRYDAQFEMGRDAENRSTLRVVETITADFPANQNRGLARVFVKKYDGHSTSFKLESVTDEKGAPLKHHWNSDELRIGDKDVYVEGRHTYVITYTQRDVTRHYSDTNRDEFYWDVIGHEWRVPISTATVRVKIDDSLLPARQGDAMCYQGSFGSRQRCQVESGDENKVTVTGLKRGQGITMAFGFAPGTFAEYQKTLAERLFEIWLIVQMVATVLAVILMIWFFMWRHRLLGRAAEVEPIVPEYIPPSQASVATSSYLLHTYDQRKGSPLAAQLVDLAVRRYIKLYEVKKASTFSPAQYEIEIVKDLGELRQEESEIIRDMFGKNQMTTGSRLNLKTLRGNNSYAIRTMDDDEKLKRLARGEYGLCEKNQEHRRRIRRWMWWILLLGLVLLSPALLLLTAVVSIAASTSWSLTDEGLALRRYLRGLKLYIGVAETERLRMLQSPEGAEKVQVDAADEKQLVKLYERVLPYAILFGQEKEWTKQLGQYYEHIGGQPDWYAGNGAFNAAVFASSMNSLSSAASAVSSYSSSSGGSMGGGFSGGGGGGGGGGGW